MVLKVVIVDDEPLARQELQYLLEAAGTSRWWRGSNGIEAVELIRAHKPDVVFLDVQMPGLDGFARAEEAAGRRRPRCRRWCLRRRSTSTRCGRSR